jgi:uncharacterized protein with HEPN domain
MKSHQILAFHILSCIDRIEQYTQDISEEEFMKNFLIQDGVMRNIEIIAEASKKISIEVKNHYPEVPWRQIMAMRNKIVHEYFGIDLPAIWNVVQHDIKPLKTQIKKIHSTK